VQRVFTDQFIAELSLVGMGPDALGGCYLAYDLLGGKRGPLRMIARAAGYVTLCFIGYVLVVGVRYAIVAASGMGILLGIEFRIARMNPSDRERHRIVVLFGFQRGLVLGLAGISVAGPLFGAVFGRLSGAGLTISYLLGVAPTQDYEAESKPHISGHKMLASLWRAVAVGIAGIVAGVLNAPTTYWILFGLKLGLAAGNVNALVGLFCPAIERWTENLPERRLGVAGLGLIFVGMTLQSIQYWIVVFELSAQ
jgi:hypothetical protein